MTWGETTLQAPILTQTKHHSNTGRLTRAVDSSRSLHTKLVQVGSLVQNSVLQTAGESSFIRQAQETYLQPHGHHMGCPTGGSRVRAPPNLAYYATEDIAHDLFGKLIRRRLFGTYLVLVHLVHTGFGGEVPGGRRQFWLGAVDVDVRVHGAGHDGDHLDAKGSHLEAQRLAKLVDGRFRRVVQACASPISDSSCLGKAGDLLV